MQRVLVAKGLKGRQKKNTLKNEIQMQEGIIHKLYDKPFN